MRLLSVAYYSFMSKMIKLGALFAAVAVIILYVALRQPPPVDSPESRPGGGNTDPSDSHQRPSTAAPAPAVAAREATPPQKPTDASTFAASKDYFDFAKSVLDRAAAGDADAQYYLYAALDYCDLLYRMHFFRRGAKTRTLDEALQRAAMRHVSELHDVRIGHQRCSRLFDGGAEEFGIPAAWLQLATEQGQPLALATTAAALLRKLSNVGETDPPRESAATSPAASEAKAMLLAALKSKDPEVMLKIASAQRALGDPEGLQEWAWLLAACQRGSDCDNSSWLKYSCRFDHLCSVDENATDFIRRYSGLDFPEVEARARKINADIDSGSWDALGLSSAG